jgi:hypothetical protein
MKRFLHFSRGSTIKVSTPEQAWDYPLFKKSYKTIKGKYGLNQRKIRGVLFISPYQSNNIWQTFHFLKELLICDKIKPRKLF